MSTLYERNRSTARTKPVSALLLVVTEKDWIRDGNVPPELQRYLFAVARQALKFPQERVQVELPQPPPEEDPEPEPEPEPPPEQLPKRALNPKPTPEVMGVIRQQKAALQQAQRSVEDALEACALILDE